MRENLSLSLSLTFNVKKNPKEKTINNVRTLKKSKKKKKKKKKKDLEGGKTTPHAVSLT